MTNSNTGGEPFSLIPETVLYADISDGAYRVYGLLARIVNTHTWEGYALVKTLAERLGKSESYVKRNLKELGEHNLIDVKPQWTNGDGEYSTVQHKGWRQTANLYSLPLNKGRGFKSEPQVKTDTHPGVKTERGSGFKSDLQNHSPNNPYPYTPDASFGGGEPTALSNIGAAGYPQGYTQVDPESGVTYGPGDGPPPF